MKVYVHRIGFVVLFYLILIEGKKSDKSNKIKIVVPQKISYIHHHHQSTVVRRRLEKPLYRTHPMFRHGFHKGHGVDDEFDESDDETEATQRETVYYAIPAAELRKAKNDFVLNPIVLYKDGTENDDDDDDDDDEDVNVPRSRKRLVKSRSQRHFQAHGHVRGSHRAGIKKHRKRYFEPDMIPGRKIIYNDYEF